MEEAGNGFCRVTQIRKTKKSTLSSSSKITLEVIYNAGAGTYRMLYSRIFLSIYSAKLFVSPGSPLKAMARWGPKVLSLFSSDFIRTMDRPAPMSEARMT